MLLKLNAMPDAVCSACQMREGTYTCDDCGNDASFCEECLRSQHQGTKMFHVVHSFSGSYGKEVHGFANDTLELDHVCDHCHTVNQHQNVMVVRLKWSQRIKILACNVCTQLDDRLLSIGLFPGGSQSFETKSAFCLDLLALYRQLNLTSGISCYNVFHAVLRLHGSSSPSQSVYRCFLRAVLEYRQMMLKNELLIPMDLLKLYQGCRACPRANDKDRIHICADACFRPARLLKENQTVSTKPMLSIYMEHQQPVKDFLQVLDKSDRPDPILEKDCSDFYALTAPEKRKQRGLDETGVFAMFCARHGAVFAATDVFKGERFGLFDFLLRKTFLPNDQRTLTIYYDVGCRYQSHIRRTTGILPPSIMAFLLVAVPIFHVYAHGTKCIRNFNPRWISSCAMIDGEACERRWPLIGQHHKTTKEMRKENRRIVLEDQFAYGWFQSQSDLPFKIEAKRFKYTLALNKLYKIRDAFPETDEELDAMVCAYKAITTPSNLRSRPLDSPESNIFRTDNNIRRSRNQISFLYSIINQRGAASDHKIRKSLKSNVSKLYRSIETARKKRNNLLSECDPDRLLNMDGDKQIYPDILEFENINDKAHAFWHVNNGDSEAGLGDTKIDTYNLIERHKEESIILDAEKKRWISHVREDIRLLATTPTPERFPMAVQQVLRFLCNRQIRTLYKEAMKVGWDLQMQVQF